MRETSPDALRVLGPEQKDAYNADGYLLVDRLIDADTVAALNAVTGDFSDITYPPETGAAPDVK